MIVEYVRYRIPNERQEEFTDAYRRASASLEASEHCLRFELAHGVEETESFILRIEWDSLEGHEQGFRSSAEFRAFLAEVRPFLEQVEEMRHYELTAVTSAA